MKHLYFIRHGQSQANLDKIIATPDSPLTALGVSQAKETANRLLSFSIDKIFSSPMPRARQTAEVIADSIGFDKSKIVTMNELRERGFGELEGKSKDHESRWYFDIPDGLGIETHNELHGRMKNALNQIMDMSTNSSNILIIGHSVSGDMLRFIADKKLNFSALADYELTPNAGFFELKVWN